MGVTSERKSQEESYVKMKMLLDYPIHSISTLCSNFNLVRVIRVDSLKNLGLVYSLVK